MPAGLTPVCVVAQELLSAYGRGVSRCADGLLAGRSALRRAGERNWPTALESQLVGAIPADVLDAPAPARFAALLRAGAAGLDLPADAMVYLATTAGAIGELEEAVFAGAGAAGPGGFSRLHRLAAEALGVGPQRIQVVSSACASSTAALALAAGAICRGELECAAVIGCDVVSEFVLSGFVSLMAVDPDGARPFDAGRKGVAVGEAMAVALLMRADRAAREGRAALGTVAGWSLTCDANHLTGPSRDGAPLADAIQSALAMAGRDPGQVAAICAHGTGTVFNDQMELQAFRRVFGAVSRPTFSAKGGMGHTMGAAGLAEVLLSLEFLRRGRIPPTVGMCRAADDAMGWVSAEPRAVDSSGAMLSTNSGFGGTNAAVALVLDPAAAPAVAAAPGDFRLIGTGRATDADAVADPRETAALPRNFGRYVPEVRRAYFAVRRALAAAGLPTDGSRRIGIVAGDRAGSEKANFDYFSDYVGSGRALGRGQLFAQTLPTSVAAECAIGCRLRGPLLYAAAADGSAGAMETAARGLLAEAQAEAMICLSADPEGTRAMAWGLERTPNKELP